MGTVSRTATASLRGGVGRKPQAKLRPEEHVVDDLDEGEGADVEGVGFLLMQLRDRKVTVQS